MNWVKPILRIGAFSALLIFSTFILTVQSDAGMVYSDQILKKLTVEMAAKTQPLEDPNQAMRSFYEALARTASERARAITRIAHFGDSLVEMDFLAGPMRRRLQEKWGDSGHGFVLASAPRAWYKPYNLFYETEGIWPCLDIAHSKVQDRRFGLGGASCFAMEKGTKVTVGTVKTGTVGKSVSSFEILFPIQAPGGKVQVRLDGKKVGVLTVPNTPFQEGFTLVEAEDGPHQLELKMLDANVQIQGIILERKNPGVVYDALGINGAGVRTFLDIDKPHWSAQLRHRNPDLVILGLGTYDLFPGFIDQIDLYKKNMKALIDRVREALPHASILYIAPLDRAEKEGDSIVSNPALPALVSAQREVAKQMGVAFWNTYEAMGGEGSMIKWFRAEPRLDAGDLFHPSPQGGEILAEMLFNALMQGFGKHVDEFGLPGPSFLPPPDSMRLIPILK